MRNIDDLKLKYRKRYNENARKILLYLVLAPVLGIVLICDIFYYEIKDIQSQYQDEVTTIQERKTDAIYSIILSRREQGLMQNQYIINNLKNEIKNNYTDTDALRFDLVTRSSPFIDICSNALSNDMNIVKNYTDISSRAESVFICDKIGVISDNGFVEKSIINRSWSDEVSHKANKELTNNAIYMLINQNKDTIFWPSDKNVSLYTDSDFKVKEPNNYILRQLISKNNIYSLKNYNILIPSYITDTGDIFGVPDIDAHGLPNDNNKIIIVREINMFDIVSPYIDSLNQYDILIDRYTLKIDDYIWSKSLAYIALSVICFLCIFILIALVNKIDDDNLRLSNRGDRDDRDDNIS